MKASIWNFEILHRTPFIAIGIDVTKHIRKKYGHCNNPRDTTKCFALWSSGGSSQWDQNYDSIGRFGLEFDTDDEISMILNLSDHTLSNSKNKDDMRVVFKDITVGEDIEFCMAVYIWSDGDRIQLISSDVTENKNT